MTARANPSPDPAASIGRELEAHRRMLWALCYRMTGSASDADDLVQETFVRALERPPEMREDGWRRWLMRVATNLAIDALRRRKRRDYVGPWLPAPIETAGEADPPAHEIASAEASTEYRYDLMESVSMAFLLALEQLTPRQRAVLLLRDVFDYTVDETAAAIGLTAVNVKVTHHRARKAMTEYDARRLPRTAAHGQYAAARLKEFLTHLQNQDVAAVEAMLAADVRFFSDGAGEYTAAINPVDGRDRVTRLLLGLTAKLQTPTFLDVRLVNGEPALLVEVPAPEGFAPRWMFRIDLDQDGFVREVHTILATAKLAAIRFSPAEP
jgi:RNA polymerase sigma-70 factor (ECF subfamily)